MDKMKWIDWYPTLINLLREILGRNGVPLSYLCRPTNVQSKAVYNHVIDGYVETAPLVGHVFTYNVAEVHTYVVRFTTGNDVSETKRVDLVEENNGHLDLMELKDHY